MEERVRAFLVLYCGEQNTPRILSFLERGFSRNGISALCSLFATCFSRGKMPDRILHEVEREWNSCWRNQPLAFRADADAPEPYGTETIRALERIYANLEIPSPVPN